MSAKHCGSIPSSVLENDECSRQLTDLIEEARRAAAVVVSMDNACRVAGKMAINAAIKAGGALFECKQFIKHGNWEAWLEAHLPTVSQSTACRWMRLAKLSLVTDLSGAESLNEAYRLCGILRTDAAAKPRKAPVEVAKMSAVNTVTRATMALRKRLRTFTETEGIRLTPDEKNQLQLEWKELNDLFGKLFEGDDS